MTQKKSNGTLREIKAMMAGDEDFLRPMVRGVIDEFLEAEMAQAVGAEKEERAEGRLSYRSGYYSRSLVTRAAGPPGAFPPRSSSAINAVRRPWWRRSPKCTSGVSTRKVTAISEELCGYSFSASAISEINKKSDAELGRFARRELESEYPYLIVDARYEKLRENG
jgi:putative transposase